MKTLETWLLAMLLCLGACSTGSGTRLELDPDTRVEELAAADETTDAVVLPDGPAEETVDLAPDFGEPPEVAADMEPDGVVEGGFGWPCATNAECLSGYCVETAEGKACTVSCMDECPGGWNCVQDLGSRPDVNYICVPAHTRLCMPCETHEQCSPAGVDLGARCVDHGAAGHFCGGTCDGSTDCPAGFVCETVLLVGGQSAEQCIPQDGPDSCTCSFVAVESGAATTCFVENEFGLCSGERMCTDSGLTDCDAAAPSAEECDGLDNDCDAEVDEGQGTTTCGLGICEHTVENCVGGVAQTCDPLEGASPSEKCDGLDNDCDGEVDEELGETTCGKGACEHTVPNCDGGEAVACNPFEGAAAEVCDGLDNDCDGLADEEQGTTSCGVGVCLHTIDKCVDGVLQSCDPMEGASPSEECDGLDNDCDGQTDEGLGQLQCGEGQCAHTVPACIGGEPQLCDPMQGASAEVCDGKDNDCDGATDEGLGQTTCGQGQCLHTIDKCVEGQTQVCNPFEGASAEVCDGKDNDCDGLTDEEQGQTSCGKGICQHTIDKCVDGVPQVCDPFEGANAEVCDGKDNDCDGLTDEEQGSTTCGKGVCEHTVANCADGQPQLCDPLEGAADEECDGKDNDCDGVIDEADPNLGLPCTIPGNLGPCKAGTWACQGGEHVCEQAVDPVAEVCDGVDNNCDGVIDNVADLGQPCLVPNELGPCQAGEWQCVGNDLVCTQLLLPAEETCMNMGFDDDCDGLVDNIPGQGLECVNEAAFGVCEAGTFQCSDLELTCISLIMPDSLEEVCGDSLDNDCDGLTDEGCPSLSCLVLHQEQPGLPSGLYPIDPDGPTGPLAAFTTWCDMETDGGGWTYGAIVKTTTSSDNRTRVAGVTKFGMPVADKLANEFSVTLTGIQFSEVRIDNFTKGAAVTRETAAPTTWNTVTYQSSNGLPAKRLSIAGSLEFRVGYYAAYCGLDTTNIPMCFTSSGNPVGWVCDTDSGFVEGWVDPTGGEICGQYYCKKLWRDTACTSYVNQTAVYGFAGR